MYTHAYTCSHSYQNWHLPAMGWLRLVGSLKLQVSFAKEPYKRDYILYKRLRILRSLLSVATPYVLRTSLAIHEHTHTHTHTTHIHIYTHQNWHLPAIYYALRLAIHTHKHTNTHTHMHTHIYTHTYTHSHIRIGIYPLFTTHCV